MAGARDGDEGILRASPSPAAPISHQLEQVPVRIEEVEAVVIAPVDRGVVRYARLGEEPARDVELLPVDEEGVVALPERIGDGGRIERGAIGPQEQGAVAVAERSSR